MMIEDLLSARAAPTPTSSWREAGGRSSSARAMVRHAHHKIEGDQKVY
jgi:hypothetical protein